MYKTYYIFKLPDNKNRQGFEHMKIQEKKTLSELNLFLEENLNRIETHHLPMQKSHKSQKHTEDLPFFTNFSNPENNFFLIFPVKQVKK